MKNRLDLNWTLSTSTERSEFIQQYISSETFLKFPPTEEELETMANYVLWGQDEDGLNVDQKKEIQLPRRNQTWSSQKTESLDELLENPTFSETFLYQLGTAPKKPHEVFSREDIRKRTSKTELKTFEELWRQIDKIELLNNFYELEKGKRSKPPRAELLQRFSESEITTLQQKASTLKQFKYLKLRHLLVELRRQQYTLRDAVLPPTIFLSGDAPFPEEPHTIHFGEEIEVRPLGLWQDIIFKEFQDLTPASFSEKELKQISILYWKKQEPLSTFFFDFRELEMVYQLLLHFSELSEEEDQKILKTFWYYASQADLSDIQQKILNMKIQQVKNQDIAAAINREFGKNYTSNYISTIFRQKIIPAINNAAIFHAKIVGSLFFEEEFKTCTRCGRLLLRDPSNFVRRSRAKDGLSNHCKKCDKELREQKKVGG